MKKTIVILIMSILLVGLSACGKNGGKILPINKLEFGMTREQVNSIIAAEPDDTIDDLKWITDVYLLPSDFNKRLSECHFGYNGNSQLYGVKFNSNQLPESEALSMQEELMKQLEDLYGFSEEDWDYCDGDVSTYVHVTETVAFVIVVWFHEYKESDEYEIVLSIFYDYPKSGEFEIIPIIPQK